MEKRKETEDVRTVLFLTDSEERLHKKKRLKISKEKTASQEMQEKLETTRRDLGIERRLRVLQEEQNSIVVKRLENTHIQLALMRLKIKTLEQKIGEQKVPITCQVCMDEGVPLAWECESCNLKVCLDCVKKVDFDDFCSKGADPPTCPSVFCQTELYSEDNFRSQKCKAYFKDSLRFRSESLICQKSFQVELKKAKQESRIHAVYPNELFEITEKILNLSCPNCATPLFLGEGCLKVMCERCDLPTCLYCCHQGLDSSEEEVEGVYKHMHENCPINPFKGTKLSYNCPPCVFPHVMAYSKAYKLFELFVNGRSQNDRNITFNSGFYRGALDRLFITLRGKYALDPLVGFEQRQKAKDFGICPFDWIGYLENPINDEVEPILLTPKTEKFKFTGASEVKMVPNPLAENRMDTTDLVPLTMTFVPTTIKHAHIKDCFIPNRNRLKRLGLLKNKKHLTEIDVMEQSDRHFFYGKFFNREQAKSRAYTLFDVYHVNELEKLRAKEDSTREALVLKN